MAQVFLARAGGPRNFERLLIIKRILPQFSEDEEFVDMFVAEAKISALLHHGNIVQVFEFGEVDDQLFLAMEYVDGTDLRALLKELGGPLPPHVAAFIAMGTLNALAYAHARMGPDGKPLRIVHRDVSPANILLSRAGEVKLCDFGIARFANRQTAASTLRGKFGYLSPEQVLGEPVDWRSDLFSVGILLWEMLSGDRLFTAESGVGILEKVRNLEVPELDRLTGPANERLRATVRRALQREPARRHKDAWAFAEELAHYLAAAQAGDPVAALRELVSAAPRLVRPARPPSQSGVVATRSRPGTGARPAPPAPPPPPAPPALKRKPELGDDEPTIVAPAPVVLVDGPAGLAAVPPPPVRPQSRPASAEHPAPAVASWPAHTTAPMPAVPAMPAIPPVPPVPTVASPQPMPVVPPPSVLAPVATPPLTPPPVAPPPAPMHLPPLGEPPRAELTDAPPAAVLPGEMVAASDLDTYAPTFLPRRSSRALIATLALGFSLVVAAILIWVLRSGPAQAPDASAAAAAAPVAAGQRPTSEVPAPPPPSTSEVPAPMPTAEVAAPAPAPPPATPEPAPPTPTAAATREPAVTGREPATHTTRTDPTASPSSGFRQGQVRSGSSGASGASHRPHPAKEKLIDPFALGSGR